MNFSGTINAFRLLLKPQLCIPHLTVNTFDNITIPIRNPGWPEFKAVVLDKDNCFAVERSIYVYKPYEVCLTSPIDRPADTSDDCLLFRQVACSNRSNRNISSFFEKLTQDGVS